jgi:hypothetical protein
MEPLGHRQDTSCRKVFGTSGVDFHQGVPGVYVSFLADAMTQGYG